MTTTMMMMTALMIEHEETVKRMAELDTEMTEIARQAEEINAELADLDGLFN
jgi:predicted  nucleic acid-binding Zn-ribbon protein